MSNDTQVLTLAEFLLARIAEDEAMAKAAQEDTGPGRWSALQVDHEGSYLYADRDGPGGGVSVESAEEDRLRHAVRHDPARVLAECKAKRRIVREYVHAGDVAELEQEADRVSEALDFWAIEQALEPAIRALASVYADHPDFREEWRS